MSHHDDASGRRRDASTRLRDRRRARDAADAPPGHVSISRDSTHSHSHAEVTLPPREKSLHSAQVTGHSTQHQHALGRYGSAVQVLANGKN